MAKSDKEVEKQAGEKNSQNESEAKGSCGCGCIPSPSKAQQEKFYVGGGLSAV